MKGSVRMPKPEVDSSSPVIGLRVGTEASLRLSRPTWPLALRRRHQDDGVVDRRGLWRRCGRKNLRRSALRRLDRAGRRVVRQGGERGRAGFEQRLAARDLVELAFHLLLIEQLTAGEPVDL